MLCVTAGEDGQPGAVYDVKYEEEEDIFSVDHLLEDLQNSSLQLL